MTDEYDGYDPSVDDPYVIPGSSCLRNNLGLTDTAALNDAEEQYVAVRLPGLMHNPITPTFDLAHLQAIHARLFGDVYPFAGEIRIVEISKGGLLFLPCALIAAEACKCFEAMHSARLLEGLDATSFGSEAGYFLGWINRIHPFREGNGRTQRVLLDQLAEHNGYVIEWAAMSKEAMVRACRAAREARPDYAPIRRLIALNTLIAERG